MIGKLDFLVRYWELKARHATQGAPLDGPEQVELLALFSLVTGGDELPTPGHVPASQDALNVELIGEGAVHVGELRQLSSTALFVQTSARLPEGVRVVLRATDAIGGIEYSIPCRVAWTYGTRPNSVALLVDGIPARSRFSSGIEIVQPSMPLGRHEPAVS